MNKETKTETEPHTDAKRGIETEPHEQSASGTEKSKRERRDLEREHLLD